MPCVADYCHCTVHLVPASMRSSRGSAETVAALALLLPLLIVRCAAIPLCLAVYPRDLTGTALAALLSLCSAVGSPLLGLALLCSALLCRCSSGPRSRSPASRRPPHRAPIPSLLSLDRQPWSSSLTHCIGLTAQQIRVRARSQERANACEADGAGGVVECDVVCSQRRARSQRRQAGDVTTQALDL